MNQFPQALYRLPGSEVIEGVSLSTLLVRDSAELEAAQAEGWHPSVDDAKQAHDTAQEVESEASQRAAELEAAQALEDASKPPTRDELEQMATKLKLPFSARVSDKKLAGMIAAATANAEG